MSACDVCELAGFCQFMNKFGLAYSYPELEPFLACNGNCKCSEDYKAQYTAEMERLKDGGSPLKHFTVAQIIAELEQRTEIKCYSIGDGYGAFIVHEIECLDRVDITGPAKIIVVKGVE